MAGGVPFAQVVILAEEPLRGVVVSVENNRREMQLVRPHQRVRSLRLILR